MEDHENTGSKYYQDISRTQHQKSLEFREGYMLSIYNYLGGKEIMDFVSFL